MTILVTVSGAGKTPRSFKGDVPEDAFRAEIRGYYLYPSNREWPRRSVMAQFDAEQPAVVIPKGALSARNLFSASQRNSRFLARQRRASE